MDECFRLIVLGFTEEESIEQASSIRQFGPAIFSNSSPESVIRSCEAVKAAPEPSAENPIIFTLPATIEISKPPMSMPSKPNTSALTSVNDGFHQDAIKIPSRKASYGAKRTAKTYDDGWQCRVFHSTRGTSAVSTKLLSVVQKKADEHGRELLSADITDLFKKTYFLLDHPRFNIIDYSISIDRSTSPVPLGSVKTQGTRNLLCLFESIVSIDGREYQLRSRGNGPILPLASALKDVDIDLCVADYKEHATGGGREVKAAT
ncbi:hypothetical protein F5X96DRAFT_666251 [Biscogniauxia mediterranea]|nr:hypothetical protein F5X96DRAFT_666251 [Biscogniauxia mediterranea]